MQIRLQEIHVKSVITKSNLPGCDYAVNPYVGCPHACMYCYASFMKRFTGHTEPWGWFVDVKHWPAITNPWKYAGTTVFIGSVTDPYNPFEERFCRTRTFLEQMQGSGIRLHIQTKSDLVLRDAGLLRMFPGATVGFSINTLDETFKNDMDRAVSIERRCAAMKALHGAGIRTTCFIAPLFPGITDAEAIIDRVQNDCTSVWIDRLNLRRDYTDTIMKYILHRHPHLLPLYKKLYLSSDGEYWSLLDSRMHRYADEHGLRYVRKDDARAYPPDARPVIVNFSIHEERQQPAPPSVSRRPRQGSLLDLLN